MAVDNEYINNYIDNYTNKMKITDDALKQSFKEKVYASIEKAQNEHVKEYPKQSGIINDEFFIAYIFREKINLNSNYKQALVEQCKSKIENYPDDKFTKAANKLLTTLEDALKPNIIRYAYKLVHFDSLVDSYAFKRLQDFNLMLDQLSKIKHKDANKANQPDSIDESDNQDKINNKDLNADRSKADIKEILDKFEEKAKEDVSGWKKFGRAILDFLCVAYATLLGASAGVLVGTAVPVVGQGVGAVVGGVAGGVLATTAIIAARRSESDSFNKIREDIQALAKEGVAKENDNNNDNSNDNSKI